MMRRAMICLSVVLYGIACCRAESESDSADSERLNYLSTGFRDARESLRQFEVTAQWKTTSRAAAGGVNELISLIHCWSDERAGNFRFDRKDTNQRSVKDKDLFEGVVENRFVRTLERTIHAPIGIPGVFATIEKPGVKSRFDTFDVRSVGIAMPQELPLEYDTVSRFFWTEQTLIDISDVDDLVRVIFLAGNPSRFRRTVFIDERHGFTPVRFECCQRSEEAEEWGPPRVVMNVEWIERDAVWVPMNVLSEDVVAHDTTHISFEWKSVNAPLDARLFTYEGIGLENGAVVADTRLGDHPVVLAVIGQPLPQMPPPLPTLNAKTWLLPALLGIAALASLSGFYVIYRRRVMRPGKS